MTQPEQKKPVFCRDCKHFDSNYGEWGPTRCTLTSHYEHKPERCVEIKHDFRKLNATSSCPHYAPSFWTRLFGPQCSGRHEQNKEEKE